MRKFMHDYIEAQKRRREEHGEEGFSLIELIVVVVILAILAAIAIPIFLGIQQSAKDNALKAVAGTAAAAVAADLASNTPNITAAGTLPATVYKSDGNATVSVSGTLSLSGFCVTAVAAGSTAGTPTGATAYSGPGKLANGTCP
jgi:type IV pilus assembly protein PilA